MSVDPSAIGDSDGQVGSDSDSGGEDEDGWMQDSGYSGTCTAVEGYLSTMLLDTELYAWSVKRMLVYGFGRGWLFLARGTPVGPASHTPRRQLDRLMLRHIC